MRIRKTQTASEFESVIDDFITRGYEVQSRGETTCKLREHGGWGSAGGHLVVFLLTVWWTFFIGNIVYALYKRYSGEQVLVKLVGQDHQQTQAVPHGGVGGTGSP